jgi:hypothetical protein
MSAALGIVLGGGSGSEAHAGDRILDVEASFFGALAAAGVLAAIWYLLRSRRQAWARATPHESEDS